MRSVEPKTIERMQQLLQTWEQKNDQRKVFLGCYHMMTLNMIEAIRNQAFMDQVWVEHLLHHFADYYFKALEAYEYSSAQTPIVWRQTFDAVNQLNAPVLQSLLLGVNAHINYDLILALVDLLQHEWLVMPTSQREERYSDHCKVNAVIYQTIDAVQDTIIEPTDPRMEVLDRLLGPMDEWAISRLIRVWRDQVWQDAVALLEARGPAEEQRLRRDAEKQTLRRAKIILMVT